MNKFFLDKLLKKKEKNFKVEPIFYNEKNGPIFLNDRGDKSDLHGKIEEENIILASTSKNLNKENIGKFDLRDILQIHTTKYKNYELHVCICVKVQCNYAYLYFQNLHPYTFTGPAH